MVILIGLLGIYFTHKVVGPIYKMKLLLRQVGDGKLTFRGGLRKGDELQDFFEVFASMVEQLKRDKRRRSSSSKARSTRREGRGRERRHEKNVVTVRDEMKRALDM